MLSFGDRATASILVVGLFVLATGILSDDYFRVALCTAMIFGLFAASTDISFGFGGILNLGAALFFGLGAYGAALGQLGDIPYFWTLVLVLLVSASAALVICWAGLTDGRTSVQFGLLGLVLSLSMEQVIISNYDILGGSNGLAGIKLPYLLNYQMTSLTYFVIVSAVVIFLVCLIQNVTKSHFGRVLILARDEPEKAQSFGYDVWAIKTYAVVMASALAALSGALYAPLVGIAYPGLFAIASNMVVLVWVIVGGRATIVGPFVGAVLFKTIEFEIGSVYSDWYLIFLALIFLAVVIFLPGGLVTLLNLNGASRR